MTLTKEQIDQLFQFCEKQGVQYYDVQVEIVDHIAENIENNMDQDPSKFEDELEKSVITFGRASQFKKIEVEKENQLKRKARNLQLSYISQYFRWPSIITTAAIIFSCYYMAYHLPTHLMSIVIRISLWTLFIYYSILSQIDTSQYMKLGYSGGNRKSAYRQIKPLLIFKNSIFYFRTLSQVMAICGIVYTMGESFKILYPNKIFVLLILCIVQFVICNAFRYTRKNLMNAMVKNYPAAYELKNNYEDVIL